MNPAPPPPAPPLVRSLLSALTVFALAFLALAAVGAWQESGVEGWGRIGIAWLALERFADLHPWRPAAAGAGLVLAIGLGALRSTALARVAHALRFDVLGHPGCTVAALVAALGLPPLAMRATRPLPAPNAPNVLFVLVDTWRADHAGFLGYRRGVSPNLDRLARQGVVFEHAVAQSSWTKPSVATLLTGLLPSRHHAVSQSIPATPVRGFRLNPRLTTFIELLHGRGWQTAMWSDNPNITPPVGFGQGAESFRDYFHEPCHAEDCGTLPEIVGDVERWFEEERDERRPFCLYVHVMDAHYPYEPPPEFRGKFDRNPSDLQLTGPVVHDYMTGKRSEANLTPERLTSLVDRYDEELLAVDHVLGPFLERVRRTHPNTVIVLAGDHGEEFHEHGNLGHSHALWEELVRVPLVLWAPGLDAARIPSQVRLVDVCPTLLELVGQGRALPGMQGESLLPVLAGLELEDRPAPLEVGGDQKPAWQWRGLSDGRWKMLRREPDLATLAPVPPLLDDDSAPRPTWYLFDLEHDPHERQNLAAAHPDIVQRMFDELNARGWYVDPRALLGLEAAEVRLDPELAHRLTDLGYGGGHEDEPPSHSP